MEVKRRKGICRWFSDVRGYGFILSEGEDYFVHFSGLAQEGYKSLGVGTKVTFVVGMHEGRPRAEDVRFDDE